MKKLAQNLLEQLYLKSKRSQRECLYKDCNKSSIDSHLLQKRGIISQIEENGHVWELASNRYKDDTFYFRAIGVNDAFSFPGFCTEHDNALFKEIESGNIDFSNYRTQLLFSYRALMNEMRKKEIAIDWFDKVLSSTSLRLIFGPDKIKYIHRNKKSNEDGITDGKYYERFFLNDILNPNEQHFQFVTISLPRTELCSSAVFTYETTQEIAHISRFKNYSIGKPLSEIYFNFFPTKENSIIIMGCLKERVDTCWNYVDKFQNDSDETTLKRISDLLLCQVENWICSKRFYEKYLKKKTNEIVKIMHESLEHPDERRELKFNLFI